MAHSTETNEFITNLTNVFDTQRGSPYETVELIIVVVMTGSINLMTIIGNIFVIISIKTNRHLQTINNYFIFSLACADLILGVFTMNAFTIYTAFGYWPMGPVFCDLWLVVDYVVNTASGINLLLISFDRYFCITKPLSYPIRRTPKIAGIMIATAWVVSFILWAPAIVFWQFIVGERTIPEGECYPQLFSNPAITLVIIIAVFYLPVTIMVTLYVRISFASKSRMKWTKIESKARKGFGSPSLCENNVIKPSTNNASSVPIDLFHAQSQNVKLTVGMAIEKCEQGQMKDVFTETNSLDFARPNPKEVVIQANAPFSSTQNQILLDPIELASMKIPNRSQLKGCIGTTVGVTINHRNIVMDSQKFRPDDKIGKVTKIRTNKKEVVNREKTVTRTILAIILAFIITWTPYFIMVIITTFCPTCITHTIWNIGNWIIYINSTINPACYALCNATFKRTFKHLLFCQYKSIGTIR